MDYNKLKEVKILEWYDGPLLIEFRDDRNNCYLFHWADLEEINTEIGIKNKTIWLVFNVSDEQLEEYLNNKICLLTLYLNSKNDNIYVLYKNYENEKQCFEIKTTLSKEELIENYKDYLPLKNCYFFKDKND